jgi:uncharacterized surface protein with fasciclin (FAS1) repeats
LPSWQLPDVLQKSQSKRKLPKEQTMEEPPKHPQWRNSATLLPWPLMPGLSQPWLPRFQAAGLVETLQGEGPFTVFAPTDEAFAALPEGLLEALLLEENRDVLVQILTYHVVSGSVFAADVTEGDVPSVEGSAISITVGDGVVVEWKCERHRNGRGSLQRSHSRY